MNEALDLWRVQIHCDDVTDTNNFQKIGYNPRHDRFPPAVPLVRPSVTEESTIAVVRAALARRQASARVRSSTR